MVIMTGMMVFVVDVDYFSIIGIMIIHNILGACHDHMNGVNLIRLPYVYIHYSRSMTVLSVIA